MQTSAIGPNQGIQNIPVIPQEKPSLWVKIGRIWDLLNEVCFKEFFSVLKSVRSYFASLINPNPYGLNPKQIQMSETAEKTAKVVFLLHGVGGGPFCFFL